MFHIAKKNKLRQRKINKLNKKQCSYDCDYLATGLYEHQHIFRCVLPSIMKGELKSPKGVFLKHFAKFPERCDFCINLKTIKKQKID